MVVENHIIIKRSPNDPSQVRVELWLDDGTLQLWQIVEASTKRKAMKLVRKAFPEHCETAMTHDELAA